MINPATIPDYIMHATPMTVGELRKKIKNLPADMNVYIVIDKLSEYAWDDDKGQWRYALPLVYATRERLYSEEGNELNLLLEYESE